MLSFVMSDEREPPLNEIADRTLAHYEANAAPFWAGTRDHDVTPNYAALLGALGGRAALRILDFGCGPGRDLVALTALGHLVTGLDGMSRRFDSAPGLRRQRKTLRYLPRQFSTARHFRTNPLFVQAEALSGRSLPLLFQCAEIEGQGAAQRHVAARAHLLVRLHARHRSCARAEIEAPAVEC